MASATHSPLHRQVNRVSQRLFLQTLLNSLAWSWTGALAVSVLWFLVEPFVFYFLNAEPPAQLRWIVAGAAGVLGTAVAVALAFVLAPPRLQAALYLDERFGLRERVTTSLLLTPDQYHEPAAQALLLDADQHVASLDVESRFPLSLPWAVFAVLVLGGMLGLLGAFYEVRLTRDPGPNDPDNGLAQTAGNLAEIEKEMNKLKKDAEERRRENNPEDNDLRELQDKLDKLASRPNKTEEDLRERFGEMDKLEPEMLRKKKEMEDKQKAQKDKLDRLAKKDPKNPEGPANDLRDALSKGDFDKAKEEIDRLMKAMQDETLKPEEKEQLQKQIDELGKDLERLTREIEEEEKRLKDLADKGDLDKEDQEALERELEELKKLEKDLEELTEELEELEMCMENGDAEGCEKCMKKIGAKLQKMGKPQGDLEQLKRDLQNLREAKKAVTKGMGNKGGGPPGGLRPEDKEGQTNTIKTRVQGQDDPKGNRTIVGHGPPGRSFKPKSEEEMAGEIRQARQDAPEAINRQRLPKGASDLAKGYYDNLGGQKEEKKK